MDRANLRACGAERLQASRWVPPNHYSTVPHSRLRRNSRSDISRPSVTVSITPPPMSQRCCLAQGPMPDSLFYTNAGEERPQTSRRVPLEREVFHLQPAGPNLLNHRDNFSIPALRHRSLNSLFQVAKYLPSWGTSKP